METAPAHPAHELAQINIARMLAPLDSPRLADFFAALDPVNASGEAADGFVWRLKDEGDGEAAGGDGGDATGFQVFGDPWLIVNMSVWRDLAALTAFVYSAVHREVLGRRREWFARPAEAMTALWWVPAGTRPTLADAEHRLRLLRAEGPTPEAFTLREAFPPSPPVTLMGESRVGTD
jgi:hypothetical protein